MVEAASPIVVRRSYIDGIFGQMHVRRAEPPTSPSARPVLCIHLSPLSGLVYERLLPSIGADRIAVAPDTPGYGMSDGSDAPPDIETYSRAMAGLADSMGFGAFDVIGYGTGSKIAFHLALTLPGRIRHVALISAPDYTEDEVARMRATLGAVIDPTADGSHMPVLWSQVQGFPDDKLRMRYFPDHIAAGPRKPWGPRAAFTFRYRDRLAELTQPLMVLNIDNEITEPTRRLGPLIGNGRYIERLDWRHGFLDRAPDEFAAMIRSFVDEKS